MSEQWVNQSESLLKTIEKLMTKTERDRLEIINSMIFSLNALDRSILGWRDWIQNLDFMSRFSETELRNIEQGLIKGIRALIEYDIDITKRHENKIPQVRYTSSKTKNKDDPQGIYA